MGKRARQWFRAQKIAKKIMIVLLGVSILPILFIQFISYHISSSTMKEQTGKLIEANLDQSADGVRDFLERYDEIIKSIMTDSDYMTGLKPINVWNRKEYYRAKHELMGRLQNIAYVNPDILGIAIVGIYRDIIYYDSVSMSGAVTFCFDDKKLWLPLHKEATQAKETVYSKTYHKSDPEYGSRNFFYIAHRLTDFNNYREGAVGSILICVDEAALGQKYSQGQDQDFNITFLTDRDGDIMSYPDKSRIGDNIFAGDSGEESLEDAAKNYISGAKGKKPGRFSVSVRPIAGGEFSLINVQDLNVTLANVTYISFIIILIGLLMGIVCVLIGMAFSDETGRAVNKILDAMNTAYKGDYDVRIKTEDPGDEFEQISHHFNDMIRRIKNLNRQEREAMTREKNAEIKSLEAQINPHFLYNTLDAINWVAIDHKEFTISHMLGSLAVILRYSIHQSNGIVTIRRELEYLKKYIYLQQQRFDYSFQCVLHVEEELLDCRIHKLLLQPLIENVIIHGFPGPTGLDEINIAVRREGGDKIVLEVEDNGKGVAPELVELFNHYEYQKDKVETSIGVRNVITRVKLYYGDRGSFLMRSGESGTVAAITIPYEESGEVDEDIDR